MKKLLLLFATTCLTIGAVFAQLSNKTLTVGSTSRSYKQYLPSGFDPQNESVSVIIAMHGLGGTNNDLVGTGLNNIADTARIIVFYPQGLTNSWGQSAWNNGTLLSSSADDIGFVSQLIDSAILNYGADPTRVYAAGFSMGSIMSYHLACALNSRIAAIGCMSGTMSTSDINSCTPTYKTPVIHFHGTADGTVPYNSNALPTLSLVPETITFWQNQHGCATTSDSLRLPDLAADGYTVDRFRYDNCTPDASLELWRVNGANHEYFYRPANDFDEITETWLFFRKWQHNNPAPAGINDLEDIQFTVAPNPSNGNITIDCAKNASYTLLTVTGETIASGTLHQGENSFDWSELSNGIYFVKVNARTERIVIQ